MAHYELIMMLRDVAMEHAQPLQSHAAESLRWFSLNADNEGARAAALAALRELEKADE